MTRSGRLRGPKGRFVPLQQPAIENQAAKQAGKQTAKQAAKQTARQIAKQGAAELPGAAKAEATEPAKGPSRPSHCAAYLRRELTESFAGIVSGFVKQAQSGSVPHMKETMHLLEDRGTPKKRKGSAQRLMEELARMDRDAGTGDGSLPDPDDVWRD